MKKLFAIFLTLVMSLCFLLAVAVSGAAADSILPVLQTPKPEAIEAPVFHALTGRKAPEAEKTESGALRYRYADVGYSEYLDFGRLLAQEGFTLTDSDENASGAVTAVMGKEHAEVEVYYNQEEKVLTVTYTAWARPAKTVAAAPAAIDPATASVLPELTQVISFESATAVRPEETVWTGTSYRHSYSGVSYAAYTRFGEKLGEEGYALTSAETLEGGVSRAVVEKDGMKLTLDYDMEKETASVLYPKGVHPRELSLYGDFTELPEGETIRLAEGAALTWLGWEKVDSYKEYYKDYRYKPNPKRTSEEHTTGEGVQQVLLRFAVRLEAGVAAETADLIRNMTLYCDKDRLEMNRGLENGERSFNYDDLTETITSDGAAKEYVVACGAALTEEQLEHPEEVTLTFNDGDNAVRYVCYLESPVDEETRRKDKNHARYGLSLAGEILANAADALEAPESGSLIRHCESILKMDFLHPDKVEPAGADDLGDARQPPVPAQLARVLAGPAADVEGGDGEGRSGGLGSWRWRHRAGSAAGDVGNDRRQQEYDLGGCLAVHLCVPSMNDFPGHENPAFARASSVSPPGAAAGAAAPRSARYLPTMSPSRLTLSPGRFAPRMVPRAVVGMRSTAT